MGHPIRAVLTVVVLAVIPLLMAILVLFPAGADVAMEDSPETPGVTVPAEGIGGEDPEYNVTIDTGTVVVLSGSVISAKTVTATTAPAGDPVDTDD